MKPVNFLRCEDGAIINVAQVLSFDVSFIFCDRYAVAANFATTFYNVAICETRAEAVAELDRLYERLCSDPDGDPDDTEMLDITPLIPPRRPVPVATAPDPFNSEEDRTTHTCGESACCLACEDEAFAQ